MQLIRFFSTTLGITTLAAAPFLNAAEEGKAEEIVVTADFRQSVLQNISGSISVLNAEDFTQQNARHLEEVIANSANVNTASGASRARFFQIRGIGERGQFSEPLNSSVGLMIDGVDFSGIGTLSTLYDIEQVEILIGPQGTRYGSNALAGLINLQSKNPSPTAEYGAELEVGNLNTQSIAGVASGPISNSLLYRLSFQTSSSDGFSSNTFLDRPTNQKDEDTLRAKLRWLVSESTNIDFQLSAIDIDNGYDAFSLDNVRDTLSDEPGFDRQDTLFYSVKLDSLLDNGINVQANLSRADSDIEYGYDEDWVFAGFHPSEYSSTDHYFRQRETDNAELRFLSSPSSLLFGKSEWVAGIYSQQQTVELDRQYTFLASPYSSTYDIDRLAIYADITTPLNGRLSLETGLRLENVKGEFSDSLAVRFTPDETVTGGRLGLNYEVDDDQRLYALISSGYKAAGFNTDGSLDADLREFDSESLVNYELGYKAALLDDTLHIQTSVFYMDRDDVQISSSTTRLRANGSTEFISFTGNAAAGSNYGVELNTQWQANERLRLQANLGLLNSEYKDFINSAGDNLDGREQAHAPSYQFSLSATVKITQHLEGFAGLQAKDGFFYSDSHSIQSDSYQLWNASLNYQKDNWQLSLWGRNLGDEDYPVRGFFFGNDPRDGYTAKGYTQLGEPRRYGLTLKYTY